MNHIWIVYLQHYQNRLYDEYLPKAVFMSEESGLAGVKKLADDYLLDLKAQFAGAVELRVSGPRVCNRSSGIALLFKEYRLEQMRIGQDRSWRPCAVFSLGRLPISENPLEILASISTEDESE